MKAIVCQEYGSPDVLQLREVVTPVPKEDEILIKIHASSGTPSDCAFRKGEPFIIRLMYGLRKPKPKVQILGVEIAGEVEAIGKAVTSFKPGDPVFGMSPDTFGGYAEYVCVPETAPMVTKPAAMPYEEAVGILDGGLTSLTFLRDISKLQRGQKVLINGASGAVGAYAVQLAKYFGAEVTGVCSSVNVVMVKALGADHVIDYTREDFTRNRETYDVIFDAVGMSSYSHCKEVLSRNGIYMTTVPSLGIVFQMLRTAMLGTKKAKFAAAGLMQNKENLTFLTQLFETGKLRAVIDRCYPLEQTAEAHRYIDTGHKKGNVVITVIGEN